MKRTRTALRVGRIRLAVLPEEVRAPRRIVQHSLLIVARTVRFGRDIGRKRVRIVHYGEQLVAYCGCLGFHSIEPRELIARIELYAAARGNSSNAAPGQDPLLAQYDIERGRESRMRAARGIEPSRGQALAEPRLVLSLVARAHLLRMSQFGCQVWRDGVPSRRRLECCTIKSGCRTRIACDSVVVCPCDQRTWVARIRCECAIDRRDPGLFVAVAHCGCTPDRRGIVADAPAARQVLRSETSQR